MMLRADRAEDRQLEAKERVKERAARSPEDQLALLDHRLGKDVGAVKERKRLRGLITQPRSKKV